MKSKYFLKHVKLNVIAEEMFDYFLKIHIYIGYKVRDLVLYKIYKHNTT